MDDLEADEKAFYKDQQGNRKFRLSEHVDEEYEKARSERRAKAQAKKMQEEKESKERQEQEEEREQLNADYADPSEFREIISPTIPRGSRIKVREEQTTPVSKRALTPSALDLAGASPPQPIVRVGRNVDERYKDAIATVSYRSALSLAKSRVAVQAVCEKIYHHRYFLSVEEKEKDKPSLETINEDDEPASKKPRTKKDYEKYAMILPSVKVVQQFKHNKSLHQEITAAKSLYHLNLEQRSPCITILHREVELMASGLR